MSWRKKVLLLQSGRRRLLVFILLLLSILVINLLHNFLPFKERHFTYSPATKYSSKKFVIFIWKHGERMKRRFLRSYGAVPRDPYEFCPVNNCELRTGRKDLMKSHAILFHLHQTLGPHTLPKERDPRQFWIFFTDESPKHTFLATHQYTMKDYNGLFNWSMTYRSDSDIPVPYGRTLELTSAEKPLATLKGNYAAGKKGVAILGSNCGGLNFRWNYVHELEKYLQVDIYGGCGKLKCPGHFTRDCLPIKNYKFYLAFENSNCREYITEKLWWNAYHKEVLPIVMGAPIEDYKKLCPPNSFIHVDSFEDPAELAQYIHSLDQNDTAYNQYFQWKKDYKVVNEHGYFGSLSLHLCHICEALNFKSNVSKVYSHLEQFWNPDKDCFPPHWHPP